MTKVCSLCREDKDASEFIKRGRDGTLWSYCRMCSNEKTKRWKEKNREARRLITKKWQVKSRRVVSDSYTRELLNTETPLKDIPPNVIAVKKIKIVLDRLKLLK